MIVTLGHSYVEAQEINANRVLLRRDSHSAAHKTGCQQSAGTTNYVISDKLVPSFRRHSLKDFEQPKSGLTLLFVKFLLSFRNKDIISYKILQKIFLLHRHIKGVNRLHCCDGNLLFTCCWRAIARQHTILYNRAKSAKSVGCKIGDMRSRLRFLYPGIPGCL